MVRTCANPACSEPFVYFRSGKIYLIDRRKPNSLQESQAQAASDEYFWLCGKCAGTMRVVLCADGSVGIVKAPSAVEEWQEDQLLEVRRGPQGAMSNHSSTAIGRKVG
jgi:hypothetical protein